LKLLNWTLLSRQVKIHKPDGNVTGLSCHGEFISDLLHPIDEHRPHVVLDSPSLSSDEVVWVHKVKGLMPFDLAADNLPFQNFRSL
jgi:hypothetical protein